MAPAAFGGGNKLIHNVVGGIGVVQGNGGILRPGLPWQTIHDGDTPMHEPLRLSVMIEAPQEAITDILERHPEVRALFDNGWLHLFALEDGQVAARYRPGLAWADMQRPAGQQALIPIASHSPRQWWTKARSRVAATPGPCRCPSAVSSWTQNFFLLLQRSDNDAIPHRGNLPPPPPTSPARRHLAAPPWMWKSPVESIRL